MNEEKLRDGLTKEHIEKVSKELGLPVTSATLPVFAVYVFAQENELFRIFGKMKKRKATEYLMAKEIFGDDSSESFEVLMEVAALELLHMGCFELGENSKPVPENEGELFSHLDRGIRVFAETYLSSAQVGGNG